MNRIYWIFLVASHLTAVAQTGYEIEGKIKGLTPGVAYLAYNSFSQQLYVQDSVVVKEGDKLIFRGTTSLKQGTYEIVLPNKSKSIALLISDSQRFSFTADTSDITETIKIKGSKENVLLYDFQQFMKNYGAEYTSLLAQGIKQGAPQMMALEDKRKVFYDKFIKDNAQSFFVKLLNVSTEPDISKIPKLSNGRPDSVKIFNYYKEHYWDSFDFSDQRLIRTPFLNAKLERYISDLTVQTEDSIMKSADYVMEKAFLGKQEDFVSYVASHITNKYQKSTIMGIEGVFVQMVEKYYLTKKVPVADTATLTMLRDRINTLKPLLLGKKMADLGVQGQKSDMVFIHDLKQSFNVLFFYSPSCGHCRESAPMLKSFYDKFKNEGVDVMPISLDGNEEDWRKFIKEFKWEDLKNGFGGVVSRTVNYHKEYNTVTTPTVYVIDQNQKIIARQIGVKDLEPFFEMYRKNLK